MFRTVLHDPSNEISDWLSGWEGWRKLGDVNYLGIRSEAQLRNMIIEHECEVILAASGRGGADRFICKLAAEHPELLVIVIGTKEDYETVRSVFLAGVFDYLIYGRLESSLLGALTRVSEKRYDEYFREKIYDKVALIARHIFDGGNNVDKLVHDLVDMIYDDWNDDVAAQQVLDKVKEESYKHFIGRKPWLEKFIYCGDYIRTVGYEIRSRDEAESELCRYYSEVDELFKKYNVIDVNKTIYTIGKCVIRNVDRRITLGSVAEEVFLNKTYVSHAFKKMTGVSFNDFVMEVRIDRAKVLLRRSDISVSAAAELLHFSNTGYFSAKFKERVGMSPAEYRRWAGIERYSDHT